MASVDFYKGASGRLSNAEKVVDAFYYTTDTHRLSTYSDDGEFHDIASIPVVELNASNTGTVDANYLKPGSIISIKFNSNITITSSTTLTINSTSYTVVSMNNSGIQNINSTKVSSTHYYLCVLMSDSTLAFIGYQSDVVNTTTTSTQKLSSSLSVAASTEYDSGIVRNTYLRPTGSEMPTSAKNGDVCFLYE